jgi:hypothetical protein
VLREQVEDRLGAALDDALLGPRVADRVQLAVVPVLDVERERGEMARAAHGRFRR